MGGAGRGATGRREGSEFMPLSRPCLLGTDGGKHNRNLFRRSPVALSVRSYARLSARPPSCEMRIGNWDHTNGRVGRLEMSIFDSNEKYAG